MSTNTTLDVISFHLRGQNAGLIMRKLPECYVFECFELSATSEAVTSTKGRLQRSFPGPAIAITSDRMQDLSLCKALAQMLVQLDAQSPQEAWQKVSKAGSKTSEIRETLDPKHATEMLMGILRGIGEPVDIIRISKRTRDEVMWNNALKPWRRSPLWLLIRVALQTGLCKESRGHTAYKSFMIFFMAQILDHASTPSFSSDFLYAMAAKIAQRVSKLSISHKPSWLLDVERIIQSNHKRLCTRWRALEDNADPLRLQRVLNTANSSFRSDTTFSLTTLQPYLTTILNRKAPTSNKSVFQKECNHRIDPTQREIPISWRIDSESHICLTDFEIWVQNSLDDWLDRNKGLKGSCALD